MCHGNHNDRLTNDLVFCKVGNAIFPILPADKTKTSANIPLRDRGLPFSHYLSRVDPRTKVPVIACLTATGIAALLTLIYIGSSVAFNDVISLTITGFYGSYFLPAALLLYHRCSKGHILAHGSELNELHHQRPSYPSEMEDMTHDNNTIISTPLIWGPWHLPGIFGILNNLYACVYMIFVIFWSFWPPETPVTTSTMNYSVVVTGGVLILSAVWYLMRGRRMYQGPTIDEEVKEILRMGSLGADGVKVEGK